ncbi:uncharacterized protein LOC135071324 [Ostrinia nubilalis]|uniref:uncharacterized protein LOC135071324 n=1 Tax=Ostrinia nubilalis TaxID=29057 RepID=UPI00308242A3
MEPIEGKPVIQQRILPSPVVSIDVPGRSVSAAGDENSNIIFSPWKAFGPFVDTIQLTTVERWRGSKPCSPHHESASPTPSSFGYRGSKKVGNDLVSSYIAYFIFRPWKAFEPFVDTIQAFEPFVDTIQDGELLPSQDTVVLPTPRHQFTSVDEDATDPMPTTETSNKVASISQLSFMVRPDSFERGQLRLTCISTVHSVYSEQAELVINEERPQIASVLGTRDDARGLGASLLLITFCSTITLSDIILREILR